MYLHQKKAREQRFKIALRMAVPVFVLASLLFISLLQLKFSNIGDSVITAAFVLLLVSVYFYYFLIDKAFDESLVDPITKTFNSTTLTELLEKEIKKKELTLLLVSLENIVEINERFGYKKGNKVLLKFSEYIASLLDNKKIEHFYMGHFKGGDFLIALEGHLELHKDMFEFFKLKLDAFDIDDIDLSINLIAIDNKVSNDLEKSIDKLYEMRFDISEENSMLIDTDENLTALENSIIAAIEKRSFVYLLQPIKSMHAGEFFELSVKLEYEGKKIHQKQYFPVLIRLGLLQRFYDGVFETVHLLCKTKQYNIAVSIESYSASLKSFKEVLSKHFGNDKNLAKQCLLLLFEREYPTVLNKTKSFINSYDEMGFKIGIERFGTNKNALIYLNELPISIVRFDRDYITHIMKNDNLNLLRALREFLQSQSVECWVNMIEDEYSYETLKSLNIDFYQGNYIAPFKEEEL